MNIVYSKECAEHPHGKVQISCFGSWPILIPGLPSSVGIHVEGFNDPEGPIVEVTHNVVLGYRPWAFRIGWWTMRTLDRIIQFFSRRPRVGTAIFVESCDHAHVTYNKLAGFNPIIGRSK